MPQIKQHNENHTDTNICPFLLTKKLTFLLKLATMRAYYDHPSLIMSLLYRIHYATKYRLAISYYRLHICTCKIKDIYQAGE